jgi:hypothetical protein
MYYPQEPKEPSGCMQTVIITRVIFGMLALPMAIIGGAMAALVITFYTFTVSPALALIPLAISVLAVLAFARWEQRRIQREIPKDDER